MKILIIGGLHGNEPLGLNLVDALTADPLPGVSVLLGNPAARRADRRYIEADLNRVFPGRPSGNIEERRAAEIMQQVGGYDLVLDFHNTHCPDNDCGFVGGPDFERLLPVASLLGLNRVIVADYDCINKYVPTCLSVEVSLSSPRCRTAYWLEQIKRLASFSPEQQTRPDLYRFVYRVTKAEQEKFGFAGWRAFERIPEADAARLGLAGPLYPIFIGDSYTPQNYAGLISSAA